ncbi:MAG: hypothetical protein SH859_08180 [Hyphomicrobium aestuarii]|nr:hypothetical protein [Hyphomicrobium aestuarii]
MQLTNAPTPACYELADAAATATAADFDLVLFGHSTCRDRTRAVVRAAPSLNPND